MARLTRERGVIVTINAVILLIMALLFGFGGSGDRPNPVIWAVVFVPPILAILSTLLREHRVRRMAYLAVAVSMLPAVFFGIWGAWGWMYAFAIIFLLIAAWGERTEHN